MKNKYLTTELPLDQPEYIDYNGTRIRRDGKQADNVDPRHYLVEQTFHLNQQSQDDEQCS